MYIHVFQFQRMQNRVQILSDLEREYEKVTEDSDQCRGPNQPPCEPSHTYHSDDRAVEEACKQHSVRQARAVGCADVDQLANSVATQVADINCLGKHSGYVMQIQ
jgi:hypothetical protein